MIQELMLSSRQLTMGNIPDESLYTRTKWSEQEAIKLISKQKLFNILHLYSNKSHRNSFSPWKSKIYLWNARGYISSQIESKVQISNFALDRPQMQQLAIS